MQPTCLTQDDLAKRWFISSATLARWRSDGIGPVFMKIKGQVRYRLVDIEAVERSTLHSSTDLRVAQDK